MKNFKEVNGRVDMQQLDYEDEYINQDESEIDKAKRKILELTQFIKDEEAYIKNSRVRYNIRLNAEINDLLVDYVASVREETVEIIRLSRACERIIGIYLRSKIRK